MKGILYILLSCCFLAIAGCAVNYPVESELYQFSEIRSDEPDGNEHRFITFTYTGGAKITLKATTAQWMQIKHLRNQNWNQRKDLYYRLNYRDDKLLSFYKVE